MTDLFDFKPAFGKTDTSREAVLKIIDDLPKMRRAVFDAYSEPRTTSEAAVAANVNYRSAQPRTSELVRMELIVDTGDRRKNEWGNNEKVYINVNSQK